MNNLSFGQQNKLGVKTGWIKSDPYLKNRYIFKSVEESMVLCIARMSPYYGSISSFSKF